MSDQRLAWSDAEKALLAQTRYELPRATIEELTRVFNLGNRQKRTSVAVRTTLRKLGLSSKPRSSIGFLTMPAALRDLSLPKRSKVNFKVSTEPAKPVQRTYNRPLARYDWGVLELGIFLPLHPLLAEARQYATRPQTPDLCVALPWPSTLGKDAISKLKCGKKDKFVLQQYMDYLSSCTAKLGFSPDERDASQGVQYAAH